MATFLEEIQKLLGELLAAFLVFVLLVFVLGELYAMYFSRAGNGLMVWLPVALLLVVLGYLVLSSSVNVSGEKSKDGSEKDK